MTSLAPTLQAFFTDRLIAQRRASPHTIAGYRDTFRLLLGFAAARTGKRACRLDIADLDATLVAAFLDRTCVILDSWLLSPPARTSARCHEM